MTASPGIWYDVGMGKYIDIVGQKFGKLTAIKYVGKDKWSAALWKCVCECGEKTTARGTSLRTGRTKSCGCLHQPHGLRYHPLYGVWLNMVQRCTNKDHTDYVDYGGRGITVCDRWMVLENFIADMGSSFKKGLTLDRIDNDKGYWPDNCRWATMKEQSNNHRNNKYIEWNGKQYTIAELADKLGMNYSTIKNRVVRGYPIEDIVCKGRVKWTKRNNLTS